MCIRDSRLQWRGNYRTCTNRDSAGLGVRGRSWTICSRRSPENCDREGLPLLDARRGGARCLSSSGRMILEVRRAMPITIGAKRESDFTDPIGMLGDCCLLYTSDAADDL